MKYEQETLNEEMFALTVVTNATFAAGHLTGAAAAANVQIGVFNPIGSGVDLVLSKYVMGVTSGTVTAAGPVFHAVIANIPTLAATGTPVNQKVGGPGSRAKTYSSAGGAALTGAVAATILRQAALNGTLAALETATDEIEGSIVIPEGSGWVPQATAAGTSILAVHTLVWKERLHKD